MASCKIVTNKKEDHKLIERKRRHDMKSLCSILTLLIPVHLNVHFTSLCNYLFISNNCEKAKDINTRNFCSVLDFQPQEKVGNTDL